MSKDVLGLGSQGSQGSQGSPASGASGASLASVDHLQPITGVAKQGAGVGSYVKCRNGQDYR